MPQVTIAAVGDIMLGDHPVCFGHGVGSALRKGVPIFGPGLRSHLSRVDVVVGNLETVLSAVPKDSQSLRAMEMRADPQAAALLRDIGVDIVTLANNHIMQHGEAALRETVSHLHTAGVEPMGLAGASGSIPIVRSINGETLVFAAYSLRPEHFSTLQPLPYAKVLPEELLKEVETLSSLHPEASLVVSLHWGEEYIDAPSASQIELGHELVRRGVRLILGHHPHVMQGVEVVGDSLIAYSLGNLMFDSWQLPTRQSAVLTCRMEARRVVGYELSPVTIGKGPFAELATGNGKRALDSRFMQLSQKISRRSEECSLTDGEYAQLAADAYLKYRMECYAYFITRIWRYSPRVIWDSLFRAALRKVGLA
ncbi:MAG: CapA family protein [Pseudomonadota bacterium]|nr:CapA family protein [Pseudomonadota bacterium]